MADTITWHRQAMNNLINQIDDNVDTISNGIKTKEFNLIVWNNNNLNLQLASILFDVIKRVNYF